MWVSPRHNSVENTCYWKLKVMQNLLFLINIIGYSMILIRPVFQIIALMVIYLFVVCIFYTKYSVRILCAMWISLIVTFVMIWFKGPCWLYGVGFVTNFSTFIVIIRNSNKVWLNNDKLQKLRWQTGKWNMLTWNLNLSSGYIKMFKLQNVRIT